MRDALHVPAVRPLAIPGPIRPLTVALAAALLAGGPHAAAQDAGAEPSAAEPAADAPPAASTDPAAESTEADAPAAAPAAPHVPVESNFVAVVIGLSIYANLPDAVHLNFARSDAATVAQSLSDNANFDKVWLLSDREATREKIREMLRTEVPQRVGPDDTLLIYFVGHGIGADLGVPTLLAFDSTLEAAHEDAFAVEDFARDIATWVRAGTTLVVTDAIHKNQLDGVYFYGPAADQWPVLGPHTMLVSASSASKPGADGSFGVVFADAISGAADADSNGAIVARELADYLKTRMVGSGQTPSIAGNWTDDLLVAQGVTPGMTYAGATSVIDQAAVYGSHEVYAAKFVFKDGGSQTVACRDVAVTACDPTCYVRGFKAGPCTLSAVLDGQKLEGVTLAMTPGKYECGVRADRTLYCAPPAFAATPAPTTPPGR